MCSRQIAPTDVGLYLVDPFSNAWHETFELDCCRKKMKCLHWGAYLWQRHPATRSMYTRKVQDICRQKWFSWLLACVLDFQQEMDLEVFTVTLSSHLEKLCDLKGHWMSLQHLIFDFFYPMWYLIHYFIPCVAGTSGGLQSVALCVCPDGSTLDWRFLTTETVLHPSELSNVF